jgi:hypothetical protein
MKNNLSVVAIAISLFSMIISGVAFFKISKADGQPTQNLVPGDSVIVFYQNYQWQGAVLRKKTANNNYIVRRWNHDRTACDTTYVAAGKLELHPRLVFERYPNGF